MTNTEIERVVRFACADFSALHISEVGRMIFVRVTRPWWRRLIPWGAITTRQRLRLALGAAQAQRGGRFRFFVEVR